MNQDIPDESQFDSVQMEAWFYFCGINASAAIEAKGCAVFCDTLTDSALEALVEYINGLD